jgi:hypothetical protein
MFSLAFVARCRAATAIPLSHIKALSSTQKKGAVAYCRISHLHIVDAVFLGKGECILTGAAGFKWGICPT